MTPKGRRRETSRNWWRRQWGAVGWFVFVAGLLVVAVLAALLLALLGLNLWLLIRLRADRAERRRGERELFARLVVLETDRARAQLAAAGGPAAPRERGVIPRPVEDRRPGLRRVGVESG